MSWNFELVAGPYGGTAEGPVWDGEAVLFTHIPASKILRYDPKSGAVSEYFDESFNTNGLCFDAQGNLYGCQQGRRRIAPLRRREQHGYVDAAPAGRPAPQQSQRPGGG